MAKVELHSALTTEPDPDRAAEELLQKLAGGEPRLVTLFASWDRDQQALNRAVRERLPKGTRLIGASSAAEIDGEGMHQRSVLLGALSGDFEIGLGLGRGLTRDAYAAGAQALRQAAAELGTAPADLDNDHHVGVVMDDGYKYKKEEFLLGTLEDNPSVLLVGGGASALDPHASASTVHVDGEAAEDAALVALFRTDAPFAALRSHWYLPTGQHLTITKVDESHQRALEIDGRPAAARYAELLGVSIDELEFGKPRGFAARPTAMRVGREYFIRSPWKPLPDGSVLFANLLEEGNELELMQIGDIAELTRRFLTEEVPARVPSPQAALLFHCGGRSMYAAASGQLPGLSETFRAAPPAVGLDVCFEIYCGFHINTTLTALVFGERA